jgi:hypothetical protein
MLIFLIIIKIIIFRTQIIKKNYMNTLNYKKNNNIYNTNNYIFKMNTLNYKKKIIFITQKIILINLRTLGPDKEPKRPASRYRTQAKWLLTQDSRAMGPDVGPNGIRL